MWAEVAAKPAQPSAESPAAAPVVAHTQKTAFNAADVIRGRDKVLIIMRGLPGSGKSTLVKSLLEDGGWVCSADDYFMQDGDRYVFDPKQIGAAHEWSQSRAALLAKQGLSPIIVDNTNTMCWEARPYVEVALEYGYVVEIVQPTTEWAFDPVKLAKRNQHGVPEVAIRKMLQRWETDFTVERILAARVNGRPASPTHTKKPPNQYRNNKAGDQRNTTGGGIDTDSATIALNALKL